MRRSWGTGCVCLLLAASARVQAHGEIAPERVVEPSGGGALDAPRDVLTEEQRERIWRMLRENIETLRREGKLPTAAVDAHPQFAWPLRAAPHLTDYGYHGISNFVDQSPAFPNSLLDYNCGTRTYDTSGGYNHSGVDIFTAPFWWKKMDNAEVLVVAAAAGTLIGKDDGHFDRSCSTSGGQWNAAYIQHDDGSIAWYGHLKNGSVTPKLVGEKLAVGEYVGVVGSSGNSSGPHLHLEVYNSANQLNETYAGPCNNMNPGDSWWISQRPYYDSAVTRVQTGYAPAVFPTCPNPERPNAAVDFNPGDSVYFTAFYRDQLDTSASTYTIYQPNGSVWETWSHTSNAPHYAWSWWWWPRTNFASGGPTGIWRFEVAYQGQTYERRFRVSDASGSGRVPGQLDDPVPLTASWNGSQVTLEWAASCVPSDTDYEVYEGTIGSWYSHTSLLCTTGGATTAAFTPGGASTYYLVVPTNTVVEGSYGFDSQGAERPQGLSSCRPRQVGGSCPICGDALREGPELCDGGDLNGETCQSQGFVSGPLGCSPTCDAFDTSGCNPCGNDVCQPLLDENCLNCPMDCNGRQNGNPSSQYCCGNGSGTNPVTCADPRCTADGNTCVN
jgi:murein DD-endopeptidase MepM/ murein hydrolase activator NlpD